LYLVDKLLHDPAKYEPTQGARVVPIFKRIGADLDVLKNIKGVGERVRRMLTSERRQPDSALFELLIALLWRRNGYDEIEFIDEAPPEKRPDFRAKRNSGEWFVECKRLNPVSDYSEKERQKWLNMWSKMSHFMIGEHYSGVLDITFHIELESLPDDFLLTELSGKLRFVQPPCVLISNDTWEVSIHPVDYRAAREHLSKYDVKYPSDQIVELIGGRREPNRGFSSAIEGHFVRHGKGTGNNRFLNELYFAVGAFWSCDADQAVERKARDIRRQLADAVNQLPESGKGVVHIGLETLDGAIVEAERYGKIISSLGIFDPLNRDLRWVYCHLFQSYAPPYDCWIIDETVYAFCLDKPAQEPLSARSAIVLSQKSGDSEDGELSVHWLRPAP
jgi:hypothetical protein